MEVDEEEGRGGRKDRGKLREEVGGTPKVHGYGESVKRERDRGYI